MEDDSGGRSPKRIGLEQAFSRAHREETLRFSQSANQNLENPTITSHSHLEKDGISRMVAFDTQDIAHISQSAVPALNVETFKEPKLPTQCEQTTTALEDGFTEQVCFGMVCRSLLF